MSVSCYSADRMSTCAILLAGMVGGVLVYVVALPLALSSPFPTPKGGHWIIENPPFNAALAVPEPDPQFVLAALGDSSQPLTFEERWSLAFPETVAVAVAAVDEAPSLTAPEEAVRPAPSAKAAAPGETARLPLKAPAPKRPSLVSASDPVERYLWDVYQRKPAKTDSSGDFTWKDQAAAKRLGMSLRAYVIGGMDPDFREQLYHAGHAMDASGIRWSMLSAFRDDYRQGIAAGFKAHGGNSQHGGSNATGGYGHGRAIDITSAEDDSGAVWHWIDVHGAKFGLRRPMPGADPAHVQARNSFHDLAHELREARLKMENTFSAAATPPTGKTKIAAQAAK